MATTERARDRAARDARRIAQRLGDELRDARVGAGLSQRSVAQAASLTQSQVSRTEAGEHVASWLAQLTAHCAVLGLRLSVRAYPVGSPVRDAGQLRLLGRFRSQVHESWRWRTEASVSGRGDLRAWDARLDGAGSLVVDAETRLHDIQALDRRCQAKWRDSDVDRMVLLVARTHHNLAVLRDYREALRATFPADTHEVMTAVRGGRLPSRNGIAVL